MDGLKKELRQGFRTKRREIINKEEKNALIISHLSVMEEIKRSDKIFLFHPLGDEVDLLPFADHCMEHGKKVCFPRCLDKNGRMDFFEVTNLLELRSGAYGIYEPQGDIPKSPENAVIILPALAISSDGYRLGYGGGYYDRYLKKHELLKPFTVTAIYSELVADSLPHNENDIPTRAYVSENGVFYT